MLLFIFLRFSFPLFKAMYLAHKRKQNVIHVCSTFQGTGRGPEQFAVDTDLFIPE